MAGIDVYADGGVAWDAERQTASKSGVGGTWAYVHVDRATGCIVREDSGVLLPCDGVDGFITNNVSELYALTRAILAIPDDAVANIYSDSRCSLLRVFQAAKMNNVPYYLIKQTASARFKLDRLRAFTWTLLDGHPTKEQLRSGIGKRGNPCSIWNVHCDSACLDAWLRHAGESAK